MPKGKVKKKADRRPQGGSTMKPDRTQPKQFYEAKIEGHLITLKRKSASDVKTETPSALLHFLMIAERMGLLAKGLLQNTIEKIISKGARIDRMISYKALAENPRAILEAFQNIRTYMQELPREPSKPIVILIGEDHCCRYSYIQTLLAMISAVVVFNPQNHFVELSDKIIRELKTTTSPLAPNFSSQKILSNALGLKMKAVDQHILTGTIHMRETGMVKQVTSSRGDGIIVCGYSHLKPLKAGMEQNGLQVIAIRTTIDNEEDDTFSPQMSVTPYGLTETEIADVVDLSLRGIDCSPKVNAALNTWVRNTKSDKSLQYVERITRDNLIINSQADALKKTITVFHDSLMRAAFSAYQAFLIYRLTTQHQESATRLHSAGSVGFLNFMTPIDPVYHLNTLHRNHSEPLLQLTMPQKGTQDILSKNQ